MSARGGLAHGGNIVINCRKHMKANSGWQTLILITSVQLALLLAGILVLFSWFSSRNVANARVQAHTDNSVVSEQVVKEISDSGLVPVARFADAEQVQVLHVLEKYELSNPGFVSLVDSKTGTVVCCCPKSNEPLRGAKTNGVSFEDRELMRMLDTKLFTEKAKNSTGKVNIDGDSYYVNVTLLPDMGAALVVAQQPCPVLTAIGKEIDSARNLFFSWALVGGLLFMGATLMALNWTAAKFEFKSERLQRQLADREIQIEKTQDAVIFGLAKLAESRDNDTGEHLDRIRSYVTILANDLEGRLPELQGDDLVEVLALASSLHDIGKVGIPDSILLKPGRLSQAERDVMELHVSIGGECLEAIQQRLTGDNFFMEIAKQIALYHHERWDGQGYPHKLEAEEIPLAARIVAVADVYDALTSKRPYKDPFSHLESRGIILSGSGSQFDPEVVAAFLRNEDGFEAISNGQQTLSRQEVRSEFQKLCDRAQQLSQKDLAQPVIADQG